MKSILTYDIHYDLDCCESDARRILCFENLIERLGPYKRCGEKGKSYRLRFTYDDFGMIFVSLYVNKAIGLLDRLNDRYGYCEKAYRVSLKYDDLEVIFNSLIACKAVILESLVKVLEDYRWNIDKGVAEKTAPMNTTHP